MRPGPGLMRSGCSTIQARWTGSPQRASPSYVARDGGAISSPEWRRRTPAFSTQPSPEARIYSWAGAACSQALGVHAGRDDPIAATQRTGRGSDHRLWDTQEVIAALTHRPIGWIESGFTQKRGTARQGSMVPGSVAQLRLIFGETPSHAVRGLADFSHVWLLWVFNENRSRAPRPTCRPPRLTGPSQPLPPSFLSAGPVLTILPRAQDGARQSARILRSSSRGSPTACGEPGGSACSRRAAQTARTRSVSRSAASSASTVRPHSAPRSGEQYQPVKNPCAARAESGAGQGARSRSAEWT